MASPYLERLKLGLQGLNEPVKFWSDLTWSLPRWKKGTTILVSPCLEHPKLGLQGLNEPVKFWSDLTWSLPRWEEGTAILASPYLELPKLGLQWQDGFVDLLLVVPE